ncbi:TPR Domain containing protein [Tritrichomonas foetus]|uniref:TPR Domain containing protein n=1 Tax=Tritrichomonas foetus TaxID=1144522 RepID=A0A1J4KIX4_9EUKA|nr:TPR Domain containing protein [Tritrichomonas foetus]|eukprot:OHT10888.1 TPR Domain containing protein [Tritrichomonas foetus]
MSQPKKSSKQKQKEEQAQINFDPSTTNIDELLPHLIKSKHIIGISTVLEAYHEKIQDSTLLSVCVYLARNPGYASLIEKFYERLNKNYPVQVASIKAYILINSSTPGTRQEMCNKAVAILEEARKSDKKNPQILFNLAYIYALLHNKELSFTYLKGALAKHKKRLPYASALLLMIRILRSNCQTEEALTLANYSYDLLNRYDRNISIEGMFAAAEKGDMSRMEFFFQKLKKNYKKDTTAMESVTKINLMLGKIQNATECFQTWSEFDKESPEFFFCCAQLCLAANDTTEALHNLLFAIQLDPENAEYIANLATILFKTGSKDKACDYARAAIRANPDSVHAWLAMSSVTADETEARECLNKAIELRKTVVDLSGISIILNE